MKYHFIIILFYKFINIFTLAVNDLMKCQEVAKLDCQNKPIFIIQWQSWGANPNLSSIRSKSGGYFCNFTNTCLCCSDSCQSRWDCMLLWSGMSRLYKRLWRPWHPLQSNIIGHLSDWKNIYDNLLSFDQINHWHFNRAG